MAVDLRRTTRHKLWGDKTSPVLHYLVQEAKTSKMTTIEDMAVDIAEIGALSPEDVLHTMQSFVKQLRKTLVKGNRVKVEGLGIFYLTFKCKGAETEKDCTVKCIHSVNIRFLPDKSIKLVNDSLATTRSATNNVVFQVNTKKNAAEAGTGGGTGSGTGGEDEFEDPTKP